MSALSRALGGSVVAVVLLLLWEGAAALAAAGLAHPLVCKGRSDLKTSAVFTRNPAQGVDAVALSRPFLASATRADGQGLSLRAGECSWRDRSLRGAEPAELCLDASRLPLKIVARSNASTGLADEGSIVTGDPAASALLALSGGPSVVRVFNVYNDTAVNCLRVVGLGR